MENFFKKYKKLRLDQKIDLKDIENRTKINIKYLTALESGDFDLIQKPYTKLFLRAYINEIGADPEMAVSELSEYLLKNDNTKAKETNNIEKEKSTSDKIIKDVSIPSEKKNRNLQDGSSRADLKTENRRTSIPPNLFKGILFLAFWVMIIIVIRNITLENKNDLTQINNEQINSGVTQIINFQQLQADFIEVNSLQTVIEQSLPLIVKIVTKNPLGVVSAQDSLEIKSFSITSGDYETYSIDKNLDILLNHSEGVTVFLNGNAIQEIRSQKTPVRLMFSIEPKSVTIKHYSKVG